MQMIEIAALDNGAHRNQTMHGNLLDGWAVVPVDPKTLKNFPYGNFEVEDVDGVPHMVADSWEPLPMPEPDPPSEEPETEPSVYDELDAAYREGVDSV